MISNIDIKKLIIFEDKTHSKDTQILKIHSCSNLNYLCIFYKNNNLVIYRICNFAKVLVIDLLQEKFIY